MKSYCVKQRKQTLCIGPSGYETAKNGRLMHFCTCSECGIKKTRFVKSQEGGALYRKSGPNTTDKIAYVGSMVVNPTASWGALGRLLASQAYKGVKDNYDHYKSGSSILDKGLKSGIFGSPWQVDYKKGLKLLADPELWAPVNKMPVADAKKLVQYYKDQYKEAKKREYSKSYNTFVKEMGWGAGVDIHEAIGRLPKPKSGWTLPGHRYTGPYNPLDKQLDYNPVTGQILEIYDKPTGKTDAIAMQHDVDYSVCKDNKKCKNKADRKMVKALDAIPYKERQWGHWLARNAINTKQKLGLGVKQRKTKNGKGRRVKKTGKKN